MDKLKGSEEQKNQRIKRLSVLSRLLDSAFSLPIIGVKFGWDSIIGFIPVVGDTATFALSGFILREAWMLKVPWWTFIKMCLNVIIDTIIGAIPIAGDLFDVVWKANERNMRLLKPYLPAEGEIK